MDDEVAASVLGVNVLKYRAFPWLVSCAISAVVGALFAWNTSYIDTGTVFLFNLTFYAFVYAVFGAVGSIIPVVISTIFLYLLSDQIVIGFPTVSPLIIAGLFMVVIIAFPGGLYSILKKIPGRIGRAIS
jgi:branched-chain amino acid transport system permease protein